jgi:hypothetical protein
MTDIGRRPTYRARLNLTQIIRYSPCRQKLDQPNMGRCQAGAFAGQAEHWHVVRGRMLHGVARLPTVPWLAHPEGAPLRFRAVRQFDVRAGKFSKASRRTVRRARGETTREQPA